MRGADKKNEIGAQKKGHPRFEPLTLEFRGLSSAQNPDTVDHGTVTRDHGIRTARFRRN